MPSFLLVEEGKLFVKKSSFEEFILVFFTTERIGLFWNATKAVKFWLNFQVHFGQDNYVFSKGIYVFLNVL